jgi:hypothetical protein
MVVGLPNGCDPSAQCLSLLHRVHTFPIMALFPMVSDIPKASLHDRSRGRVDSRLLVASSRTPFCDAARALLAEGVDPSTRIMMRRAGSATDPLTATVGGAAKLIVEDGDGVPRFRPWKPFSRWDGQPEIARSDRAAAVTPEMQTLSGEPARGSKGGRQ